MPNHHSPRREKRSTETAEDSPRRRILVVDDEPLIREFLFEALTTCGYGVTTVESALEALDELRQSQYDLLLVDIRMPVMTGMEFFQRLGEQNPVLQSHVIFITGDVAWKGTRKFLEMANRPVLTKPFALADLRSVVAECLGVASSCD